MFVLFNYISSFFLICTSNWFNFSQCVKVWEYFPAYIRDYQELKEFGPYYQEKGLKKMT